MAERDGFRQFTFGEEPPKRGLRVPWKWLLLVAILGGIATYAWLYERDRIERAVDATLHPEAARPALPTSGTLYKWRAEDGSWTVSDRRPPAGTDYEVVE